MLIQAILVLTLVVAPSVIWALVETGVIPSTSK